MVGFVLFRYHPFMAYVENSDFVPNPGDLDSFRQTTGLGSPEEDRADQHVLDILATNKAEVEKHDAEQESVKPAEKV